MGADWANFAVRFKEHVSTDNWEDRLHEVVKRIALFDPPCDSVFTGYENDTGEIVPSADSLIFNPQKKYCEMIWYEEVWGYLDEMYDALVAFITTEFPTLDFELHQQMMYGNLSDRITIVENGKMHQADTVCNFGKECYSGFGEYYTGFGSPDRENDPYHIPYDFWPLISPLIEEKDIEGHMETAFLYWFCDQFK